MYNIPLQQNNLKKRKKYGTKVEKNEGEGSDPEIQRKEEKKKKRGKKNRINYYYYFFLNVFLGG